ncbi:MAG: ABC transporter ATP-binding protein [Methylocystis sp.]|nr:ABC transporter ATP-binding protein [Methylocystis sp.]MCA3586933.1 ABC transporter ATP-binding protein [Methylocystis sp.]MCA3592221.1 ABC transporter ATP-binding protein [Methylocystis sp.]
MHSRRDQLIVLAIILASLPFYFASFDIPKRIINEAIQGRAFADGQQTAPLFAWTLSLPGWLGGGTLAAFEGFEAGRIAYLFGLSFLFLALVIINGAFKQLINTQKGVLGERMLRRFRFDLYGLMLRLKPEDVRAMKPAEAASIINNESEPIGGFIGDAFIQPMFLGMQALTALAFITLQNMWLGMVALAIVLIQAFIIPELRRELLRLSRLRQIESRRLSGRIGELVEIAPAIQNHAAGPYTKSDIGDRLGILLDVRVRLFKRKFAIKYLNNLLAQITPFFFYAIGGYLAIKGQLDIGQLVAAIAAYRDLPPPIKELIDWDQDRADVIVKYEQIVSQFPPESLKPPEDEHPTKPPPGDAPIVLEGVRLKDRLGQALIEPLSLTIHRPAQVALAGAGGLAQDMLARIIGRQITTYNGTVRIGGMDLASMENATARTVISYAGPEALLFHGSIRDNVAIGLVRTEPPETPPPVDPRERQRQREALKSGNPLAPYSIGWIDAGAPMETAAPVDDRVMAALFVTGMAEEVYRMGLQGRIDPEREPDAADRFLEARRRIRRRVAELKLERLIEPFDALAYNSNASIAENLLFGVRQGPKLADDALGSDAYLRSILEAEALVLPLADLGLHTAESAMEVFSELPVGNPLFERFSFVRADMMPEIKRSVEAVRVRGGVAQIGPADLSVLLNLALGYVETRLRLGLMEPLLQARIVRARNSFRSHLPQSYAAEVEFYDAERYCAAAPVVDNLLFGRIAYGIGTAQARVSELIAETLRDSGLTGLVNRLGLDFDVGVGGRQLLVSQRAAVALARAIVLRPDILIVDGALSVMTPGDARKIMQSLRRERRGRTLLAVMGDAAEADGYDQVLVFDGPRLIENRTPGSARGAAAPNEEPSHAAA